MNILVTGGLGFIGFNFILRLIDKNKNKERKIIIVDNFSYAALPFLEKKLEIIKMNKNIILIRGDIVNYKFKDILKTFSIKHLINFASETHVDNSIKDPNSFFNSNIMGTANILNNLIAFKDENKFQIDFIHISTDEVFGHLESLNNKFNVNSPLNPRNPYSASKASAELLINSYKSTFDLESTIINCCNNYGPFQHFEKLIPKTISNIISDQKTPIYGTGANIREWIFVEDFCDGIIKLTELTNRKNNRYLFGSEFEIDNISMFKKIHELLSEMKLVRKSYKECLSYVRDRLGHDFRYSIDSSKTAKELMWNSKTTIENGLKKTIEFYLNNQ